jgi:hypothetical protein
VCELLNGWKRSGPGTEYSGPNDGAEKKQERDENSECAADAANNDRGRRSLAAFRSRLEVRDHACGG